MSEVYNCRRRLRFDYDNDDDDQYLIILVVLYSLTKKPLQLCFASAYRMKFYQWFERVLVKIHQHLPFIRICLPFLRHFRQKAPCFIGILTSTEQVIPSEFLIKYFLLLSNKNSSRVLTRVVRAAQVTLIELSVRATMQIEPLKSYNSSKCYTEECYAIIFF